ncbi:ABC transporter ATP-binding protein [Labrys wisconsinensis]|uniref:Spermidine/putrescine transport system ATP-binding protein n=1 Tax=Labrys wisconsinensis TaxID=425677 RepID=A0ABU0JLY0_9HYPH|nr:ABC transporter ATP-binding protein [Labrys wisconsinensis]MDQ0474254.1 spermidine/putrescine transport system ATP-binding protein [Labrys wisconsinensis]
MAEPGILLRLRSVSKSYGSVAILHAIDLDVRDGEFITLLGPSGSGKTTILRLIGGFTAPSGGEILLDGRDIAGVPINRRPFNTVFQDYALFPHLTVEANIGYGLVVRGTPRAEIATRVRDAIELVQLGGLGQRYPAQLSGGQRQRVALARAIICRPRLILLDEPLAALDVELRRQMQSFLKSIQTEIRTTFLFVTHDQEEAIAMADRICVMNAGRIQQIGSPHEVYYRPSCEFVAKFFGENNLIPGTLGPVEGTLRSIETGVGPILCSVEGQPAMAAAPAGSRAFAMCRPEAIGIGEAAPGENRIAATIGQVAFAGAATMATATAERDPALSLRARLPSRPDGSALTPGETVTLAVPASACRLVPA